MPQQHCLTAIEIRNFRSCKQVSLPLTDFTALVGYNNGGKSNILAAMTWILKAKALPESDFYDPAQPIVVSAAISGIDDDLLQKVSSKHRDRISPYCTNGELRIRRTQPTPGGSVKAIVLEVRNPQIKEESAEDAWVKNPTGIPAAISALFPEPIEIGAMENATEDVGKSKTGTTIGKLLAEVVKPIEEQHGAAIREALDGIKRKLEAQGNERAPELVAVDEGANCNLEDLFPGISIQVHIPPPNISDIFKNGTIKVFEEESDIGRDIDALGHGAQRSVQLALVRHLADIKRGDSCTVSRTLLLIDEPELYLHPQAIEQVRLALKSLSSSGYQVIFSTHSPQMVTAADMGNALVVCKSLKQGTFVRKRIVDAIKKTIADAPSQAATIFELSNSSQILFSEQVLFAEGKTEQRLLPEIFRLDRGKTLGACKIALVSPGGAGNIAKCLRILDAVGIPTKALVDLDYAFRDGIRAGLVSANDSDVTACRDLCARLSLVHGFDLADDGFPRNSNAMSAADSFALLAENDEVRKHILDLRNKLKKHKIWLWTKGAFDHHLGLHSKGENAWSRYAVELNRTGSRIIEDNEGINEFLAWLHPV